MNTPSIIKVICVTAVAASFASVGCGAEPSGTEASVGTTSQAVTSDVATCSSTCAGAAGYALSVSCTSSCSATSSAVTCNGVTTACATTVPVCTPGATHICCPPNDTHGCCEDGTETCLANGQWGACVGATPHPAPPGVCP